MAIPGGGRISFDTLRGEFGGTKPDAFSEYYRGAGLVPVESPGDIPSSGPISLSDFYDGSSILPNPFNVGDDVYNQEFIGPITQEVVDGQIVNVQGPATGVGFVYDQTYNFGDLEDYANFQVEWAMQATSQYDWTYGRVYIDKNGETIYNGQLGASPENPWTQDSWYRTNTGLRQRTSPEFQFGFGDEIRFRMYVQTRLRDGNDTVTHTLFRARLFRSS